MKKFLFRDIFKYTEEEINNLSLVDYELAFHYALDTYSRRDIAFVMKKVYGGKDKGSEGTTLIIPQQGIEGWIKEQYLEDVK